MTDITAVQRSSPIDPLLVDVRDPYWNLAGGDRLPDMTDLIRRFKWVREPSARHAGAVCMVIPGIDLEEQRAWAEWFSLAHEDWLASVVRSVDQRISLEADGALTFRCQAGHVLFNYPTLFKIAVQSQEHLAGMSVDTPPEDADEAATWTLMVAPDVLRARYGFLGTARSGRIDECIVLTCLASGRSVHIRRGFDGETQIQSFDVHGAEVGYARFEGHCGACC